MFYTHDYDDCYSSINNQTISRQRTSRSCRIEQSSSCCTEHFIDSGERANSLCTADAANNRILIATDSQSSVAALSKLEPYPRPHRSKHDAGSFLMLSRGRVTASPPIQCVYYSHCGVPRNERVDEEADAVRKSTAPDTSRGWIVDTIRLLILIIIMMMILRLLTIINCDTRL